MSCSRRIRLLAMVGIALLVAACGDKTESPGPRKASPDAPDIILVTIDTLRADRVGAYGYERDTTPFLDSLARAGTRFSNVYSTSSWTAPAMASLFTGRYPSVHGVVHGLVAQGRIEHQEAISPKLPVLTERLKAAGYATFGVSANRHLAPELGFGRGFDRYACVGFANAEEVRSTLAPWRSELAAARPYFLWIHLFDPHAPYGQRQPYFDRFWGDRPRFDGLLSPSSTKRYASLGLEPGEPRMEFVEALYDSEVRFADAVLAKTLRELPRAGRAAVVVTSDHGEEFAEHGKIGHGHNLYNETVKVPLIIRVAGAGKGGQVVEEPVSLVDVPPTILALARAEPVAKWPGLDLLALGAARRELFFDLSRGREVRGVLDQRFKYLYNLRRPKRSELFDLAADPGELADLAPTEAARAARLKNLIIDRAILDGSDHHRPERMEISPEHLEQLRALGYVE